MSLEFSKPGKITLNDNQIWTGEFPEGNYYPQFKIRGISKIIINDETPWLSYFSQNF